MPPIINKKLCIGCGTCASICPMRVFVFHKGKNAIPEVKYGDECWHCLACEMDCKQHAIKVRLPLPMMMPYIEASQLHKKEGE